MLKYLKITDFAIIDKLSLEFEPGLNVITGETGSGKSLLLGALAILIGGRAPATAVRFGSNIATVEGAFEFSTAQATIVNALLEQSGIAIDAESDLIIRREIGVNGRSRIFLNNQLGTLALLKELQPLLANIQGQGEHLSLFTSDAQRDLIDTLGRTLEMKSDLAAVYGDWKATVSSLKRILDRLAERSKREDFLRFQIGEIDAVNPIEGEEETLQAERNAGLYAERIRALTASAYLKLYESDESALSKLGVVERELAQLSDLDERVKGWVDPFVAARAALEDIGESIRQYAASLDLSEGRLDQIEGRLADLERLKRKCGTDVAGILKLRQDLAAEIASAESLEADRDELMKSALALHDKYLRNAEKLSTLRKAAVKELARLIETNFESVALDRARFEIRISRAISDGSVAENGRKAEPQLQVRDYLPSGLDKVDFYFTANPGEPLKLLAEAASGGELSRLFLLLHTVGMKNDKTAPLATVAFDEIDVGIGGHSAAAVGRRLQDLAKQRQVLCVTHQPQIARFADLHYAVSKEIVGERTRTLITRVSGEARIREFLRMVGGKDDEENRRVVEQIFRTGDVRRRKSKTIPANE